MASRINIFDAHVRSFSGELPGPVRYERFAIKNILYADRNITVNELMYGRLIKCMRVKRAADVPEKGRKVGKNEPLATLIDTGRTRNITSGKLERTVKYIKELTEV
jgi:predicted ATP-grasp superfamily ATP-dependent carboligase